MPKSLWNGVTAALLTVLSILSTLGWSAEPPAAQEFRAELAKEDDRAGLQLANDRLTVDIHSKSGIGKATLTRTGEKWPNQIVLRLHLTGLEMFRVTAGKTTINASVSSTGEHEQRAQHLVGKTEVPLKPDDPLWPTIRMLDAEGKPSKEIPLKNGCFEITLPAKLLEGNPPSIAFEWIDFYRG